MRPDLVDLMDSPVAVDLFCGAGGASEGLEQAGFDVRVANELNSQAALTYKANHVDSHVFVQDVRCLGAAEIRKAAGARIDLIFAGAPCQGFSTAGRRKASDPRNFLFLEALRIVHGLKPSTVLFENVPGLLTMQDGKFISEVERKLMKMGYHVSRRILDASQFGVPQRRKRVFVLASVDKEVNLANLQVRKRKQVSVEAAIGDLDFLETGGVATEYLKIPRTNYQRSMRGRQRDLMNHEASSHTRKVVERFSRLREGETLDDLPDRGDTRKRDMLRLTGSKPSPTILTLPDDYVHYSLPRILTVREAARLQSFPDSYVFMGPRTTGGKLRKMSCPQYSQVGNAVPPMLMKAVAEFLLTT